MKAFVVAEPNCTDPAIFVFPSMEMADDFRALFNCEYCPVQDKTCDVETLMSAVKRGMRPFYVRLLRDGSTNLTITRPMSPDVAEDWLEHEEYVLRDKRGQLPELYCTTVLAADEEDAAKVARVNLHLFIAAGKWPEEV